LAEAESSVRTESGPGFPRGQPAWGGGSDRVGAERTQGDGGSITPQLILIATGSEVSLALEARETLSREGVATRVVSMPCWELFEEQPEDYRKKILPSSAARLGVEAGVRQGWDRWVGPEGDVLCLDRFGASAPGDVAMRELGFNVENVVKRARALL
jgi:transketolase